MAQEVRLSLFGAPLIYLDQKPVDGFVTRKALALFIYLAMDRRVHLRDKLATLFWRDVSDAQAQNSLRTVLPNLRKLVGSHLLFSRQSVAFNPRQAYWIDVDIFRNAVTRHTALANTAPSGLTQSDYKHLENALALYKGDFLDGFFVKDAPAFDEWVLQQREELHELAQRGFSILTEHYLAEKDYAAGLATSQRLLEIEPWYETAYYQRMLLYLGSGQRTAALKQYESCQTLLAQEFGLQPSEAMSALYDQIKSELFSEKPVSLASASTPHQLVQNSSAQPVVNAEKAELQPGVDAEQTAERISRQTGNNTPRPEQASFNTIKPLLAFGEMPRQQFFAGRQTEIAQLEKWLTTEQSSLIAILGVGGTGKTSLAANIVRLLASASTSATTNGTMHNAGALKANAELSSLSFQSRVSSELYTHIIWRSLLNAPPLESVIRFWLQELSNSQITSLPANLDEQLSLLFGYLRQHRCLLVLDNLESILQSGEDAGNYLSDYSDYGVLIQRMGELEHRSCLLFTSRELPLNVARLKRSVSAVQIMYLDGLPMPSGIALLRNTGLNTETEAMKQLVERYSGNPLALQLAAETVINYYDGDAISFLSNESLVFEDIRVVLDQQFSRLSKLEREIIFWLTVEREPVSIQLFITEAARSYSQHKILEAVRSLQRRSLVERSTPMRWMGDENQVLFGLQNVVLEYATATLCDLIYSELLGEELDYCVRIALVKAQSTDYVRASQARLILQPITQRLLHTHKTEWIAGRFREILSKLRQDFGLRSGYAAANLIHMACQLALNVDGWDFSDLPIWQADLSRCRLPNTNFARCHFAHSTFMEKFDTILTAAVSQDGELLAAAGANGNVHLWRLKDQELLSIFRGNGRWIWSVAFAPKQKTVASGGSDTLVHLWKMTKANEGGMDDKTVNVWHTAMAGHTDTIFGIAFHPSGQWLASASADHTVRLWDIGQKELIRVLVGHTATVYAVAFHPSGEFIASGSRDCTVRIWEMATGRCLQVIEAHHAQVIALSFSRDGRKIVTASVDNVINSWRFEIYKNSNENSNKTQLQLIQSLHNDAPEAGAFALSPDGEFVAVNGPDSTIRLWQIADHTLACTLQGHTENAHALVFHPDGNTLISGGGDRALRYWDLRSGFPLRTKQGYTNAINELALDATGELLVSGNADGTLYVWHWQTQSVGMMIEGHRGAIKCIGFDASGRLLASGGSDHKIRLWNVLDGQLTERQVFAGHRGALLCVTFSPRKQLLASSCEDQTVLLWDIETGEYLQLASPDKPLVHSLVFSPDGSYLAGGDGAGHIYLWKMEKQVAQYTVNEDRDVQPFASISGGASTLAFSPNGEFLASAGSDHTISLWRICDGERLLMFETPVKSTIFSLAFRPNGTQSKIQLASCSGSGAIYIWEIDPVARCWELRHTLMQHKVSVYSILYAVDGNTLISGGADESIRLWNVDTGECLTTLPLEQPYVGMNIRAASGLTTAQRATIKSLGGITE